MGISDMFSKRGKKVPDVFQQERLPKPLRVQIVHILGDGLPDARPGSGDLFHAPTVRQSLAEAIVNVIRREHGLMQLNTMSHDPYVELTQYVLSEKQTDLVLDGVEVSFRSIEALSRSQHYKFLRIDAAGLIEELNHRFREHGVGYQYEGGSIIPLSSTLLHADAVQPALLLLSDKQFAGPDQEIRKAFEHYRKDDAKSCLNECLKAFESTMKAICDKRGWTYRKDKDTASALIQAVLDNGLLPDHNKTQLDAVKMQLTSGIPTTRNRLGGHGQGSAPTKAPDHIARYMLHLTAATILMLVESERALA